MDAVTRKSEKRGTHTGQAWEPNSPPDGSRRLHLDPHIRPQAGRGAGDAEAAATPVCISGLASGTPSPRPLHPRAGFPAARALEHPPSERGDCLRPGVQLAGGKWPCAGLPDSGGHTWAPPTSSGAWLPLPEAPATCTSRLRATRRPWDAESGGRGVRRTGHQDVSSSLESCSGKHHGGAENRQILAQEQTRPSSARAVNPGRQADHLFSLLESHCFG